MFNIGTQKSTNFYVLCDLNMFISSESFLKKFLGLLGMESYHLQIVIFQLLPFLGASSLFLILTTLNKTGESGYLCLAPGDPDPFGKGLRAVKCIIPGLTSGAYVLPDALAFAMLVIMLV